MRRYAAAAVMGLTLALAGCGQFDAPDQNASTLSDLTAGTPSRVALAAAAQGLLGSVPVTNAGLRGQFGFEAQTLGILGHEAYNLDVSNPQNIPTFFSPAGGNSFKNLTSWTIPYATVAQANLLFSAVDHAAPAPVGLSDAEKEAVKGYAQTIKALSLFQVIRATDQSGAALDALSDPTADPPPIASRAQVYARILQLLDSANGHLVTAGAATPFPFNMTDGFQVFNTAGTWAQFAKGLRAKVNVTSVVSPTPGALNPDPAYTAALNDLTTSFLDTTKAMSYGAYLTFSGNSGDILNGLFDPTGRQRYADSSFATAVQLKTAGGARDDRFTTKIDTLSPNVTRYAFNAYYKFKIYNSTTAPAAILKNEDLILLRAEANLNLGNTVAATTDINTVRAKSGGLPPYTAAVALKQPTTLLSELLYDRQFSLMYENGDRWVDLRRYGLQNTLIPERAGDVVWSYLMIPINECLPRTPQPAGCTVYPPHYP